MIRFGTAGVRGDVETVVTPATVLRIARAVADHADAVVIGRDGRQSGDALVSAAVSGVASGGANYETVGCVPTAALAYGSRGRWGLMLTASHNPPGDNGVKVFRDGKEINQSIEDDIQATINRDPAPVSWSHWTRGTDRDILNAYLDAVTRYVAAPDDTSIDLTVAIDCGRGVGGLATPSVVRSIGADVTTVNGSPDGHFPTRPSKPTPKTLTEFGSFVRETDTDIGIAHDGDADRIVVLDADGTIVHEDTVLAILAAWYVSNADIPSPVVVTTPNASTRIDDHVETYGGVVARVPLGRVHEVLRSPNTLVDVAPDRIVFAAEPWKHIHPPVGPWIDGTVSAGLLVRLAGLRDGLSQLRAPIAEIPYSKSSVDCPSSMAQQAMERIETRFRQRYPNASFQSGGGLRMTWNDGGWVLVRPSGTEPKLRCYIEHPDAESELETILDLVGTCVDDVT